MVSPSNLHYYLCQEFRDHPAFPYNPDLELPVDPSVEAEMLQWVDEDSRVKGLYMATRRFGHTAKKKAEPINPDEVIEVVDVEDSDHDVTKPVQGVAPKIESVVPSEKLTDYCMLIFGEKGVGKTSLIAQFPHHLICMWEPRRKNVKYEGIEMGPPLSVPEMWRLKRLGKLPKQTPWERFQSHVKWFCDQSKYKLFGCDTVDRAYEACVAHHVYHSRKMRLNDIKDYGQTRADIKADFDETLSRITYAGKTLILTSHCKMRAIEERSGVAFDTVVPSCKEGAMDFIRPAVDIVLFYGVHGKRRVIRPRGDETYWGTGGVQNTFLNPDGEQLAMFLAGDSEKLAYERVVAGFNNELDPELCWTFPQVEAEIEAWKAEQAEEE